MDFVTIDFETADYARKSACSVGLAKYHNGKMIDTFYSLIRPPRLYIRPDLTALHDLTVKDVKNAPTFAELWYKISNLIGDLPLAAHNASFDMGVLLATLEWYELPIPILRYFCSLKLVRRTWPSFNSHALTALAKEFGISYKVHNALDYAKTCGTNIMLAARKFQCTSIEELLKAANLKMMKTNGEAEILTQKEIDQLLPPIGVTDTDNFVSDSIDI